MASNSTVSNAHAPPLYLLTPLVNGGQQVLRQFNFSASHVAKECGCNVQLASQWIAGVAVPKDERYLEALEREPFSIERNWWQEQPVLAERPTAAEYESPDYTKQNIAQQLLLEQVDRIRRKRHEAEQRLVQPQILIRLEKAETDILKALGTANGELSKADEDRLCRTNRWIELREVIVDALDPFPDARKAVIAAIRKYEQT